MRSLRFDKSAGEPIWTPAAPVPAGRGPRPARVNPSLSANKVKGPRLVYLLHTKNRSERSVPLTALASKVLEMAVNHPIRPVDTDLLFWGDAKDNVTGERKPYDFTEAWEEAREKAGLPDLHFHDRRHEAVSRLVEAGLGDQEVAAISGHKTMQMLKRYTHLRAEDLVNKLDKLFDVQKSQSQS